MYLEGSAISDVPLHGHWLSKMASIKGFIESDRMLKIFYQQKVKDFLKKVLPLVLIIYKKPALSFYDICAIRREAKS